MNTDSRNEQGGMSLERVKEQLRALSTVEPPPRLREKLRVGIPSRATSGAAPNHTRWWLGTISWAGMAATIVVFCGVLWLWTPAEPSVGPEPDAYSGLGLVLAVDYNNSLGQMLTADYNSVRPPDINALDSNSLQ